MAHQRILKSEFFTDYDVAQMPPLHRLFFQALWCQADRNGSIEDKPEQLKARVMPYDDVDPVAVIDELVTRAFVVRYRVGDRGYLSIRTWKKNQAVHNNERDSGLPDVSKATEIIALPLLRKQLTVSAPSADGQLTTLPSPVPVPVPAPVPCPHPVRQLAAKVVEPISRVEKPGTPRESWGFQEFQQWGQYVRQRGGYVPEDPLPIFEVERWWAVVMDWTGGAVEPVCSAFLKFGKDPYWEGEAFPFRGFISQWKKYMRPEEQHAARG